MSNHTNKHEDTKFLVSFLHSTQTNEMLLKVDDSKGSVLKLNIHDEILADIDYIKAVSQYKNGDKKIFKILPIKIRDKSIELSKNDVCNTKFVIYKNGITYELKTDLDVEDNKFAFTDDAVYAEKDILNNANLIIGDFSVDENVIKIDNLSVGKDKFTVDIEPNDNINKSTDIYIIFSQSDTDLTHVIAGKHSSNNTYNFDLESWFSSLGNEKAKFDIYLIGNRGAIVHKFVYDEPIASDNGLFGILDSPQANETNHSIHNQIWVSSDKSLVLKRDTISNLTKDQLSLKIQATDILKRGKKYSVKLSVFSPYIKSINIKSARICLRNQDRLVSSPLKIDSVNKKGKRIDLSVSLDLDTQQLEPNFWDMYLEVSFKDSVIGLAKVSTVDKLVSKKIYNKMTKYQSYLKNKYTFSPYITKGQELAFMYRPVDPLESRYYYFKENIAFFVYILLAKKLRNRNIWIGFEKLAMSAHESGYYFFDYVHKNNLHDEFYYVIRKDSPELFNLKKYNKKVLYYKSFKYFMYMFAAKLFISSDTRGNSYHIRVKNSLLGREVTRKPLVFLQHGYNGIKRVPDFHKARSVFDLVIAASDYERNMIIKDWGYNPNEVSTTGLARWDHLKDKENKADAKQIFIMPTWRTWMDGIDKEEFVTSEFYKKYKELLSSDKLNKILAENNIKIKFFLHPKFKNYIELFRVDSDNIETFGFLEVSLDEMIMKSSMMISDYSSIIWEMFYLGKPCVFYHFDRDKYLEYEGSYMNFNKDLFGEIALDANDILKIIEDYIETDFKVKDKYSKMRDKYFTHVDNNNSQRIYDFISNNEEYLHGINKVWKFKLRKLLPFRLKLFLQKIIRGL